jgi:SAM-dependent methyltransferase
MMRKIIKRFVKLAAETLPSEGPIYEFGSFQVPGQEKLSDLRSLFPGKEFIGADMRKGKGVDVILDLHNIDLADETAGVVLVLDTLEHVEYPRKAIEEVYRILKPGGILILSSVMFFPIHSYPFDYWRFTGEAFKSVLKPFEKSFITIAGISNMPHTVVGIGYKGDVPEKVINDFEVKFNMTKPLRSTWKEIALSWLPPAISCKLYGLLS